MAKYPKDTGGGWYELSDGTKVQGKDEAEKAEADLGSGRKGTTGDGPDSEPSVGKRADQGTGLESLAVDREAGGEPTGEKVGDDEDDPRRHLPVAGMEVVGYAESGEPIVAGGVPTMTSGIKASEAGTHDTTIGVAPATGTRLAQHEATRDEWFEIDKEASDGSPADRLRAGQAQSPQMESETQESATDTSEAKDAR